MTMPCVPASPCLRHLRHASRPCARPPASDPILPVVTRRDRRPAAQLDPCRADGGRAEQGGSTYRGALPLHRPRGRADRGIGCRHRAARRGPAGGREVVTWAHPTTGVVPRCAALALALPVPADPGAARHDRARLCRRRHRLSRSRHARPTPLPRRPQRGRAVLDPVRAAARCRRPAPPDRYTVWGHSQGGHAVLYAGILARALCAGARSPRGCRRGAGDRARHAVQGRPGLARRQEPHLDDAVVMVAGVRRADGPAWSLPPPFPASTRWRRSASAQSRISSSATAPTPSSPASSSMSATSPRSSRGAASWTPARPVRCRPGSRSSSPRAPRTQWCGRGVTYAYKDELCRTGARVQLVRLPGVGHGFAGYRSSNAAIQWMAGRFADEPAPSDCRD